MIPHETDGMPQVDVAAVNALGHLLLGTGNDLTVDGWGISIAARNVTAGGQEWTGPAADAWTGTAGQRVADLDFAAARLQDAAQALFDYATALDALQASHAAQQRSLDRLREQQATYDRLADHDPDTPPPGGRPTDAAVSAQASAVRSLVDQAAGASAALLSALDPLVADAARLRPGPARPPLSPGAGPTPFSGVDPQFFSILLGTVLSDNRDAGLEFQAQVLKDFGLPENFAPTTVTLADGTVVTTIADGDSDTVVVEAKATGRLSLSPQLRAEITKSVGEGKTFNLVTQGRTQIPQSVLDAVKAAGGRVLSRLGPNQYVDRATGEVVRITAGGKTQPGWPGDEGTDDGGDGGTGTGGAGDGGGEPGPALPGEGDPVEIPPGEIFGEVFP